MRFSIGQKVMCIKSNWLGKGRFNVPKFCHIYTVRTYCACAANPSILVEELRNREVTFARTFKRGEASFIERAFAPLEKLVAEEKLEVEA